MEAKVNMGLKRYWAAVVALLASLVLFTSSGLAVSPPSSIDLQPLQETAYFTLTTAAPSAVKPLPVVAAGTRLHLLVLRHDSVAFSLRSPSGAIITAATISGVSGTFESIPDNGTVTDEVDIPNAAVGTWNVVFTASTPTTLSQAVLDYLLIGPSALSISLLTDYNQVEGVPVVVSVPIFAGGAPVLGAAVQVSIENHATGAVVTFPALDNGSAAQGDSHAADGLYSLQASGLPSGYYVVTATARATVNGVPVTTRASGQFNLYPRTAQLQGTVTDQGVDVDGDGLLDKLTLSFPLSTVLTSGTYTIDAALLASNGKSMRTTGGVVQLAPGDRTATIEFDAKELRDTLGVDGPYTISDVRFLWSPETDAVQPGTHLIQRFESLGQTRPYLLSALDRPYVTLVRYLGDRGIDTNGNGLFDQLEVKFVVNSALEQDFNWNALLVPVAGLPADGQPTLATATGHLIVGDNTLTLTFPVGSYGVNKVPGPFKITNLTLDPVFGWPAPYNLKGADRLTDFPTAFGPTTAYRYFQFEGGLPSDVPSLMDFVQTMQINKPGNADTAQRNKLLNTLQRALDAIIAKSPAQEKDALNTFVNQVNTQSGKAFSTTDSDIMVRSAQLILSFL